MDAISVTPAQATVLAHALRVAAINGCQEDYVDLEQWAELILDIVRAGDSKPLVRIPFDSPEYVDAAECAILWCQDNMRDGGRVNDVDAVVLNQADLASILLQLRGASA